MGCGGKADSPPPPLVVECGGGCAQIIPPPPAVVECGGGCVTITQSPPPPPPSSYQIGLGYIISVIAEVAVILRIVYYFVQIYDYCFGKGRERRLKRIRKRNEKIEKALKKAREQTEEISKIEETTSRMEEGIEQMKRESASCSCSSETWMESEDVEDVDGGD